MNLRNLNISYSSYTKRISIGIRNFFYKKTWCNSVH